MTEISQSLKNRVYYAARDGMAVTLCALLSDKSEDVVKELLNQVRSLLSLLYILVRPRLYFYGSRPRPILSDFVPRRLYR